MSETPVFWSFRRCPYAMRARLALANSGVEVELREILLRDKPKEFLETSASGTVPALKDGDRVLDESFDIMIWALEQSDPSGLLDMPEAGFALIEECDGPFKQALDHTKYSVRFPDRDLHQDRAEAALFLRKLDTQIDSKGGLFGSKLSLADIAILPFVRQFANIDRTWFDAQEWPNLIRWLDRFLASEQFASIMVKYPPWSPDQTPVRFP